MTEIRYIHVVPNSQFFNDIDQIIEFVKTSDLGDILNKEYLLVALQNTKEKSKLISIEKYRENFHMCYDNTNPNCECKNNKDEH